MRYTTRDHTGHDPETDSTAYLSKAAREFITIQLCQDINMKTSKVAQLWLDLQLASYRAAHPDKTDDDILAFFEAEVRLESPTSHQPCYRFAHLPTEAPYPRSAPPRPNTNRAGLACYAFASASPARPPPMRRCTCPDHARPVGQ